MNLTEWFGTRPGEALEFSESRVLSGVAARLPGEVLVWASVFPSAPLGRHAERFALWVAQSVNAMNANNPIAGKASRVCAQLSALPYASGSIDVFVLQHGLELEPDLGKCVREISRVLRDGGRCLAVSLDPRGLIGVRGFLGKLPRTALLEPVALHCSGLKHAHSLKLCCAREGLFCERQTRIVAGSGSATLSELCKRRLSVHLKDQAASQPVNENLGLIGAASRAATRGQL